MCQVHLDTARRPIDTYAMWGADSLIMDGICSDDGFWYFQPWLIGQGQHWYRLAASDTSRLEQPARKGKTSSKQARTRAFRRRDKSPDPAGPFVPLRDGAQKP
jgi:hypothetical protein